MLRIIRFRPFTLKDLQYVKLIKPFEDAGLVDDFENSKENVLKLVQEICNDKGTTNYNFSHILVNGITKETPSSLYQHLLACDDRVPTLASYRCAGNGKKDIKAIHKYQELQSLLGYAEERGIVPERKPKKNKGGGN